MAFNKNDLVTCTPEMSFFYGVTNENAILSVENVPDTPGGKYAARVVRHTENEDFVGTVFEFETEIFESDFTKIPVELENEIRDTAMISDSWRITSHSRYTTEMANFISVSMDSTFSLNKLSKLNRDVFRETRLLYMNIVPENYENIFNKRYLHMFGMTPMDMETSDTIINYIDGLYDRHHKDGYIAEIFLGVKSTDVAALEQAIAESSKINEAYEFEKVPYVFGGFSNQHVIYALTSKADKNFVIYITNYFTSDVITGTAVWFAEKHGINITEDVKTALLENDNTKFRNAFTALCAGYIQTINEYKRKKMFEEFSKRYAQVMTDPINTSIERTRDKINNYTRELAGKYKELRDLMAKKLYFEAKQEEDEFFTFLKDYGDNVISARIDGHNIYFDILTYMTYWDDDDYSIIRKNDRRFLHMPDAMKQMLDDIFLRRSIKLKIEQKFYFDLHGCYVSNDTSGRYREEDGEGGHGMHNPHINRYRCFGTYESVICKNISESDLLQAFNHAVAACSGITWTDGTVVDYFFNSMSNDDVADVKCLEMPDGNLISIKEYIDKFNKEGGKYTG